MVVFLIPCDLIERDVRRNFPSLDAAFLTVAPRQRGWTWVNQRPSGQSAPGRTASCPHAAHPQPGQEQAGSRDQATKLSSKWQLFERPRLVLTGPPSVPNPSPSPGVQPLWLAQPMLLAPKGRARALGAARLRIHAPIRSRSILQALCLLLLSSLLLFALFLLPKTSSQRKAGHEFREQLLFCNRSLVRTPWELEHLLSGFSSIRFASGLRNWHKSTLDLE